MAAVAVALALVAAALVGAAAPPAAAAPTPPSATLPWGVPAPTEVVPAPGTPVATASRDCAFSIELTGGDVLWVFCDTTDSSFGGGLTYFVNNTAALAPAGSPATLREPWDAGGAPYQLIVPDHAPCTASERHVAWPISGARVDGPNGTDRVLVLYESICQDTTTLANRAIATGLARWDHDPADGAVPTGPLRATIVHPTLFDRVGGLWGTGTVALDDGYLYTMRCWFPSCELARVDPGQAGDPAAWRFFDTSAGTWVSDEQDDGNVDLPGGGPWAAHHVVQLPGTDVLAMAWAYDPQHVGVRLAWRPEGPWSAPFTVPFPPCATTGPAGQDRGCYHGTVHAALSGPDSIGVGFHDTYHLRSHGFAATNWVVVVPVDLEPAPTGVCRTPFADVRHAHPFCAEISRGATAGLLGGYVDDTYRPADPVSRQAMAAFLWRSAGEPTPAPGAPSFPDVVGSQFETAVRWLAGEGITTGYPDGGFHPTAPVSRQAAAAFLWRMAGEPAPPPGAPTFPDVTGSTFEDAIRWMAAEGITTGYPDGTFRRTTPVSRQAMAAFLDRVGAFG